ncbi:MAG: TatD family hydrolase [Deltaproteobacteria bacterium]|nr:MAG: TatD family hydrolase [Deltaproteobacteria bacterium]
MFVDTHCHLDFDSLAQDLTDTLARAQSAGVRQLITIGIDLPSSHSAVAMAESRNEVFATVGVHPHNACQLSTVDIDKLVGLSRKSKVVAFGEIGLDFYRNYQPHSVQLSSLGQQLDLARDLNLPVVIHDRDAHGKILEILKEHRTWELGGVMHCFSGDWSFARRCLDLDLYLSIAGPVTFNKSKALQEVARNCPLDRLLLETDAPFLAPVPKRGKRNEPAFLIHTAEKIASLRNMPLAELALQTTKNARRLFNLPNPAEVAALNRNE